MTAADDAGRRLADLVAAGDLEPDDLLQALDAATEARAPAVTRATFASAAQMFSTICEVEDVLAPFADLMEGPARGGPHGG